MENLNFENELILKEFKKHVETLPSLVNILTKLDKIDFLPSVIFRLSKLDNSYKSKLMKLNLLVRAIENSEFIGIMSFDEFVKKLDNFYIYLPQVYFVKAFSSDPVGERIDYKYEILYDLYKNNLAKYNMLFNIIDNYKFKEIKVNNLEKNKKFRDRILKHYSNPIGTAIIKILTYNREGFNRVYFEKKVLAKHQSKYADHTGMYGDILKETEEILSEVQELKKHFNVVLTRKSKIHIINKITKYFSTKVYIDYTYKYLHLYMMRSTLDAKMVELKHGIDDNSILVDHFVFDDTIREFYITCVVLERHGCKKAPNRHNNFYRYFKKEDIPLLFN